MVLAEDTHAGLTAELVSLYRRSRVHLYVYRVYTDVRIVYAPELGAGLRIGTRKVDDHLEPAREGGIELLAQNLYRFSPRCNGPLWLLQPIVNGGNAIQDLSFIVF